MRRPVLDVGFAYMVALTVTFFIMKQRGLLENVIFVATVSIMG
jgi:hypothetical protein